MRQGERQLQEVRSGVYQNEEGSLMLINILCFAGGAAFGVVMLCCFIVAGKDDERMGIK